MTYATLMVYLEAGEDNRRVLDVARDLAARYQSHVVGVTASQPVQIAYNDAYLAGEVVDQDREERVQAIRNARAEFHDAFEGRSTTVAWHSSLATASLSGYVARLARCADLVIVGADRASSWLDMTRHLDIGDLVMRVGRPVLVVPTTAPKLKLDHVILGWKDTRETRRAALEALPLIKAAARVTIAEIAAESERAAAQGRLEDVAQWLLRHGVTARPLVLPATGDDVSELSRVVLEQAADVVVAGAYGHSRTREWILGGVTRDLLREANWCSLVAH